ncbi:MAG: hypothetical protein F4052_07105 [Dehalococcoidia bacterium]|nr:hypothetical protein [Dehalococcoidia bacterium]
MVDCTEVRGLGVVVAREGVGVEGGRLDAVQIHDPQPGLAQVLGVTALIEHFRAPAGADRPTPETVEAASAGSGLAFVKDPLLDLAIVDVGGKLEDLEMGVAAEGLGLGRIQDLDAAYDVLAVSFDDPAVPPEVSVDLDVAAAEVLVHPGATGAEPLDGGGVGGKRRASHAAVEGDEAGDVIGCGRAQGEGLAPPPRRSWLEGGTPAQTMPRMPPLA